MTRSTLLSGSAILLALFTPASANDGFGGITPTGLQFQDAPVEMVSEDLYLSLDTIKVSYVFHHGGDEDLTGEVIFPLPPINLSGLLESDFALTDEELAKDNIVGFTAKVDGQGVPVKTDRVAVIEPDYDENRPKAASYETPGKDITATLAKYKIPVSFDVEKIAAALKALPKAAKDDLAAQNIAAFDSETGDAYPMWSVIERYHWTQTFPHGQDVTIAHTYKSAPGGGVFMWRDPDPKDPQDYQQQLIKQYCIDPGTQSAIKKALNKSDDPSDPYWAGSSYYLDYVLKTANTWNGPIKNFKLTIDKGDPGNVISLCVDGIKKTGPTTFVVEKKDFTPKSDISILVVPTASYMRKRYP